MIRRLRWQEFRDRENRLLPPQLSFYCRIGQYCSSLRRQYILFPKSLPVTLSNDIRPSGPFPFSINDDHLGTAHMPKRLHLKRTPAEQAEHDLRKARRAAKKATSKRRSVHDTDLDSEAGTARHPGGLDAEFDFIFPDPGPSTSHYSARDTVEDERFEQKLWDALGDDDRLDGIEARMNEYAHVPRRWRGVGIREYNLDGLDDDPRSMDDEEYAEWVRVGIWR
jgi:hypothetical protein